MKKRYEKPLTTKELANIPDSEIDTTDIPELSDEFWVKAKLNPPRNKPNVSLRVSQEVIDFFKAEYPKGYTRRMADVLTAYVQAQQEERTAAE